MRYAKSLAEFKLRSFECADHRVIQDIFVRGGRTGTKVHVATSGSSCLGCGHWCKYVVNNWKVTAAQADKMERCEKCFGSEWLKENEPTSAPAGVE